MIYVRNLTKFLIFATLLHKITLVETIDCYYKGHYGKIELSQWCQ